MAGQDHNIARQLREAETLESRLTRLFAELAPPVGAAERLLAKLDKGVFHESHLTLDDAGPYNFDEHAALAEADSGMPDVLAAGLEEELIDENPFDNEDKD